MTPQNNEPISDVPSPVDFHNIDEARRWEASAMSRPYRAEMFAMFVEFIRALKPATAIELGSGPGFLAQALCQSLPDIKLTLLDFSEAMHILARQRLHDYQPRIRKQCRDFTKPNWTAGLGRFECVFSNQSVHELRHHSRAQRLHEQVREILAPGGAYLVCDHVLGPEGMRNDQLYMTPEEQVTCLREAGYSTEVLLCAGGLQLIKAE